MTSTTATTKQTKPTLATLKAFIRKNREHLLVRRERKFDGMTDGVERTKQVLFQPAQSREPLRGFDNTLGLEDVWIVGSSRDYIEPFKEGQLEGLHVWNCCGSFTVAIMKEA